MAGVNSRFEVVTEKEVLQMCMFYALVEFVYANTVIL